MEKGQWIIIVKFYVDSKKAGKKFHHRHYLVLKILSVLKVVARLYPFFKI
jgi:hypothetical protein